VGVIYVAMPILIANGLVFMMPELAVDVFDYGGVWLVAILHYTVGYFLFIFMLGHIYLATTGETLSADLRSMITGWVEVEAEDGQRKGERP
ncbi:MAG: cytochrome b/b6 domain-containing protein, partial [Alphaproteobacteria bacterium]|nr:cytochrome b/b6 domain-containing protein [Alphaproteobacteria bacterium]